MRRLLIGLAAVAALVRPVAARATHGDPEAAPSEAGAGADGEADARALFVAGRELYQVGRYDDAINRFEAAYRLSARPDLLFNIAQAYRQKGPRFCATALRYYERHLQEAPAADNQEEVKDLIVEMRLCAVTVPTPVAVAAGPPAVAPPLVVAPMPAAPPPLVARWPAWAMGAGALVGLTGLAGYGLARAEYHDVKDSCPCPPGSFRGWEAITTASYALMAAGGAAFGVGVASVLAGHRF